MNCGHKSPLSFHKFVCLNKTSFCVPQSVSIPYTRYISQLLQSFPGDLYSN